MITEQAETSKNTDISTSINTNRRKINGDSQNDNITNKLCQYCELGKENGHESTAAKEKCERSMS